MKIKKILIPAFAIVLVVAFASISVLAYIHREREIEGQTKIGTAKVVSITNSTSNSHVLFQEGACVVDISVNLSCNIDAILRFRVAPKFYDENDRLVVIPNIVGYNLDQSGEGWISDGNNMCFYYKGLVKNVDSLNLIDSITFDEGKIEDFEGYSVELIIEVDVLQHRAINYNNHPWQDNAPLEWIDLMKNL